MTIHTIDLHFQGRPEATAVYLVVGPDGPVLVETGPGSTLPAALDGLATLGVAPADIKHVLLTHIHLDHAGAAGWWARQGAHIYVHRRGARHLVAPERLLASAGRIYGDQMEPLWGEMLPVPETAVTPLDDGTTVAVAGLTFIAHETPGHATHHHCYQLDQTLFTGDIAGVRLPGAALIDIPAPPPEFDREVWLASLDRMEALQPDVLYPTHFGRVTAVADHLTAVRHQLDAVTQFVGDRLAAGLDRDAILDDYIAWHHARAAAHLSPTLYQRYEAANPLYMSVDGIRRYWGKRGMGSGN